MATTLISNPITSSDPSTHEILRGKKKKKSSQIPRAAQNLNQFQSQTTIEWKSETQQRIYSSKLLQALRQVRLSSASTLPPPRRGGRAVREAADRVLAVTAKGRTRWSRAILMKNRLKMKFMKKVNKRRSVTTAVAGASRLSKKSPRVSVLRLKRKNLPAVQRKARVLGRLVPGCRKESLPVILEEATYYIPALEMQVRAMTALVDLLSGSGTGTGSGAGSHHGSSRLPSS